jgi:hypothetical protein
MTKQAIRAGVNNRRVPPLRKRISCITSNSTTAIDSKQGKYVQELAFQNYYAALSNEEINPTLSTEADPTVSDPILRQVLYGRTREGIEPTDNDDDSSEGESDPEDVEHGPDATSESDEESDQDSCSEGAESDDDVEEDEGGDNDPEHEQADDTPMEDAPRGDEETGATTPPRYNLRENRYRDYSQRFEAHQFLSTSNASNNLPTERDGMHKYIVGHMMTQMTANAGIRKHGGKAITALLEEFCQLDDKSVFKPLHAKELTTRQKKDALRAINLIKEKRCGRIKGRTCADGRPQRGLYTKEQTASPTVSTDALMLSLMIDALEQRDVATADVTGAYLHADMNDFVVIKLTGDAVGLMCKANPKYQVFTTVEQGQNVLYLQLLKALYGCVQSALLWYDLFVSTLQELGFELNPYDLCVANKG